MSSTFASTFYRGSILLRSITQKVYYKVLYTNKDYSIPREELNEPLVIPKDVIITETQIQEGRLLVEKPRTFVTTNKPLYSIGIFGDGIQKDDSRGYKKFLKAVQDKSIDAAIY
ncbi:hypothetical protein WA158_007463, partial [Blastocystis sp. Blastoise]